MNAHQHSVSVSEIVKSSKQNRNGSSSPLKESLCLSKPVSCMRYSFYFESEFSPALSAVAGCLQTGYCNPCKLPTIVAIVLHANQSQGEVLSLQPKTTSKHLLTGQEIQIFPSNQRLHTESSSQCKPNMEEVQYPFSQLVQQCSIISKLIFLAYF